MPKTKTQGFVFTLMMVIVMVYGMVVYNISLDMGDLQPVAFIEAFKELPLMGGIAFLLEMFAVEGLAKKITFSQINPQETQPIFITVLLSCVIVMLMCPIMSFFGVLFHFSPEQGIFVMKWIKTIILNFPMALFWQLFVAGPLVRLIFGKIFK